MYLCLYAIPQHEQGVVTSREIALFHNLSRRSLQSISALLNSIYTHHIRQSRFGFDIMGTRPFHECRSGPAAGTGNSPDRIT
jgi:hypothetical protein